MTFSDWQAVPYFAQLDPDALRQIKREALQRSYQAGAVIFREGEACAGFHVVVEGLVRIYRTNAEGRLHTLSLLRPVATFNEVAAVDGGVNPFNAVAVTNAQVMVLSHRCLISLLASQRHLLENYVQQLAHLNREYIERLEDMTFRSIPSRLAKLFLHETTYADQISEAPTQLTQEEIGAILGTTREVVGRALRVLLNAGLLRKKGRQIFIADRDGLIALAQTNAMPPPKPDRDISP
ncbi:MAG: Crp/Fnr family transcriptional regulator [Anaerolineaceae bacterium]|nr:MAG: Crp/Fnr family transcriptional regulator [Anaerolineaceae bacterium]